MSESTAEEDAQTAALQIYFEDNRPSGYGASFRAGWEGGRDWQRNNAAAQADGPGGAGARVRELETENRVFRSLLESAEWELDWLTLHHVVVVEGADWKSSVGGRAFFACDCSDDDGYMEWDTNTYIHAEQCASGHEDSLGALHDQIRAALASTATAEPQEAVPDDR